MYRMQQPELRCLAMQVPAAAIDGVLLAGRAAHAAYYGPGEVVALLADGLRVARAAWARA